MASHSIKEITGLFGYPVEHSLSPEMHNAAFNKLGLDYTYLPFEVKPERLKEAVMGIKGLNLRGVNLTIPHKEEVIPYLDQVSKEARLIGAVNTIKNKDGKLIGYNTDGQGFITSLKEEANFIARDKNILIIGAGGAAKAIAFQLALEGANSLYISNRTISRAEELVLTIESKLNEIKVDPVPLEDRKLEMIIGQIDLVIDTTPVGMYPKVDVKPVINPKLLHDDLIVTDIVYNPVETSLLRSAKAVGAKTVSGLGMLLYQGVLAFEIWTGRKAPVEIMKEVLENKII